METGLFSNAHNSLSSLFGCNRLLLFGLPKSGRHTESSYICAALRLVSARGHSRNDRLKHALLVWPAECFP